jgi:hypothetical protein
MKYAREFITSTVVGGLLIVVPVCLAALLLLEGMKSVGAHSARRCCVRPPTRTRAHPRNPIYAGYQLHLSLGLWL